MAYHFTFQMSAHIEPDGDCPLAIVPCKYNDFGCKYKVSISFIAPKFLQSNKDLTLYQEFFISYNTQFQSQGKDSRKLAAKYFG